MKIDKEEMGRLALKFFLEFLFSHIENNIIK